MQPIKKGFILLLSLLSLLVFQAKATHIMGGEITWECLNNGQYVFNLKVYRDCNGIAYNTNNLSLEIHNYPAAGAITLVPVSFFSVTDITPSCEGSPCAGLTTSDPDIPGAIEEYILKSNPITLNGVPGAAGWIITWTSGNRNAAIDNITNAQNFGITLRAKMFAYNGQNAGTCFDSSPDFFQKPSTIICAGQRFTYNHSAFDNELDSLVYSWAQPLDGNGCNPTPCQIGGLFVENVNPPNVNFTTASGYSFNSPFPGTSQDARNVPAVLNTNTGEITFTSYNQGEFVSVIRVEAYRCGQKIAEIYRELQTVILSGCATNEPPEIPSPFANGTYRDTVRAGDFVQFDISIFDTLRAGNPQNDTVYIYGSGQQFGLNYTDSTTGCLSPPCATLSQPLVDTSVGTYTTTFKWQTTCDHIANSSPNCYSSVSSFLYTIRAFDNFCPAAGQAIASFYITILADSLIDNPQIYCADVQSNGDVIINWDVVDDVDSVFQYWKIYVASDRSGPYTLLDSISDFNQTSYTHIGAGANNQGLHYIVRTQSGCHSGWLQLTPDTISTQFLTGSLVGSCLSLAWDTLDNPLPNGSAPSYDVYREYPIGSGFVFYKTVSSPFLCDTFQVCTDTVAYRIELNNSGSICSGSTSNVFGMRFQYPDPDVEAGPDINICLGQSTSIGGSPSSTDAVQYLWSPADSLSAVNLANPIANPIISSTYYLSVRDSFNCTAVDSMQVILQPSPISFAGNDTTICPENLPIILSASVSISDSGRWLGGNGNFSPSRLDLNASYTPTTAEINAGFVDLQLISLDVGICDIDTSNIRINIPRFTASITLAVDSPSCNAASDGLISVIASGPNAPYQFLFDNSGTFVANDTLAGIGAGTYSLTVTNNLGCDSVLSITVNEPAILQSSISSSSAALCFGTATGSAVSSAIGGTSPYTFTWSDGQTGSSAINLAAGSYQVTVTDANGCTDSSSIFISEPNQLVSSSGTINMVSCNGFSDGLIQALGSGGTSPYTYLWSNGASTSLVQNISAGTYTVTLSDANACTDTAQYTITEPNQLIASVNSSSNVSCFGLNNGNASLSINGGTSPYTYLWSDGQTTALASNLIAGLYQVTVTDNNSCTDTASVNITQPNLLQSNAVLSNVISCNGFSDGAALAVGSGGTAPYTYNWSNNQTSASAIGLSAGAYYVTISDANGCTDSSSILLIEPAVLTLSLNAVQSVSCSGLSDGIAASSVNGGTLPYTYNWSNGQSTDTAKNLAAGSYTLSISDARGCTVNSSITITSPSALQSSISSSQNVSCNGFNDGSASIIASGGTLPYTYSWSNGQTNANAQNLAAGSYSVTVSDNRSCSITNTVTITEPSVLVSTISNNINVSCNGLSNGTATVTGTGGTAPYTYAWSNGQNINTATGLGPGIYQVSITDLNGCTDSSSILITEPSTLSAAFTNQQNSLCFGANNGFALAQGIGGTSPYTYNWSNGQNGAQANNLGPGTYTVTISDAKSCTITSSLNITEPNQLTSIISDTLNVSCKGLSNGSATVRANGGTSPYTYLWNNGQTDSTATNLIAGNYTVTVSDANNCQSAINIVISEPNTLQAVAGQIQNTNCYGSNDGSIVIQASGGTAPYTYLWSNNETTANINNLGAGNYSLTLTDINACQAISTFTVNQPTELQLNSSGSPITCNGLQDGSAQVSTTGGTGAYTYFWSNGIQNRAINNLTQGTYTVTVSDQNGCTETASYQVIEPLPISVAVSDDDTICINFAKQLEAFGSGGTGNLNYSWSGGLGNTARVTAFPQSASSYTVTVTDQNTCPPAIATVNIAVRNIFDDQLEVSSTGNICLGDSSLISVNFVGDLGPFTFTWNQNDINGIQDQYVSPIISTNYRLRVSDACNNSIRDSVLVQVSRKPIIDLPDTLIVACNPHTHQFSRPSDAGLLYSWRFGNNRTSSLESPSVTYTNPGTYRVRLTASTLQGCESEFEGNYLFRINPSPVADIQASPTRTNIEYPDVSFNGDFSDASSWMWYFDDGDSSDLPDPIHTYADTGHYIVRLIETNAFGCSTVGTQLIVIEPTYEVKIPNVFIPNRNGSNGGRYDPNGLSNAVFHPFLEYVDQYHLIIFNRWGEVVFESKDVNIGWDGYYKGELCQADVYVYTLEVVFANGVKAKKVGDVTLLR